MDNSTVFEEIEAKETTYEDFKKMLGNTDNYKRLCTLARLQPTKYQEFKKRLDIEQHGTILEKLNLKKGV